MSDNEQDKEQKTEDPTERRLEQAYEEGQVALSKEIVHWVFIATATLIILLWLPHSIRQLINILSPFIGAADQFPLESIGLRTLTFSLFRNIASILLLPLIFLVAAPVVATLAQSWKAITAKNLAPKFDRLSPASGLKKIFSSNNIIELLKNIVKIILFLSVLYIGLRKHFSQIDTWLRFSLLDLKRVFLDILKDMFINILVVLAFLAGIDFYYQRRDFMKKMRMTRQEIKDEFKETEGNPEVKQKIKQLQKSRRSKRLSEIIPTATALITNPTHYAIAIIWESERMNAPTVIAKGKDHIALRMRELATDNRIPIVENPPLARALFNDIDVDREITQDHYKAVAEVIRFVEKLKKQPF